MIIKSEKSRFKEFQSLLKDVNYEKIPQKEEDCWMVDSYDLFQGNIKGKYILDADAVKIFAQFVTIEKYYWTSMMMHPGLYLGYSNEKEDIFKREKDLTDEEKVIFEKQIEEMKDFVYSTPKNQHLANDFLDIGANLIMGLSNNDNEKEI